MSLYSMLHEEAQANLNLAKETVLRGLEKEGLLKGTAAEIGEKYAIVLHKKGWLGSFWDRWFKGLKDEEGLRVTFVRIVE